MLCYNCMREKDDAVCCPYCGAQTVPPAEPHHLPAGTVIGGRYTIGRVLGEGGFGITYIGLDNTLDIPVAVKEYFPYGYSQRNNTASLTVSGMTGATAEIYAKGKLRFLEEAKIIARFRRESGIVDVTDFFEENNTAYIVMEYLEGVTLRQYLKKHGKLSAERTIAMLTPVMKSLQKVHAAGVIHRDISPDNIMVLPDDTMTLMDFGAARDFEGDRRSMSVMLKHGYAPEEQYRRRGEQGPWTDVYAMCATIYRCITAVTPDDSNDRCVEDTLKKPSALGAEITPATEDVLMYGLAVRKKDRCPDMKELMRLFDKALAAEPKEAPSEAVPQKEERTVLAAPQSAEEDDVTTLATTMPAEEDDVTTLATSMPAEEDDVTTLATAMLVDEDDKTTLATTMPAEEDDKTTLATTMPAEEDDKTTLATSMPAEEDDKTTLAAASAQKPPATPSPVTTKATAETAAKKKSFPKGIIAIAAVLVTAIVILVIVNPFGKSKGKMIDSQAKAMSDYVNGQLDLTDYNYKDYRHDSLVQEDYRGKNPSSISAATIEIDEKLFPVELGKTTVDDLDNIFSVADVEENSFDDGNAYEVVFDASGFWKFRVETELFKKPHLEMGMAYCAVEDLILDYDSAESKRITPFRYQNITDKSSLKETVAQLGEPDRILLNTDDNNKEKGIRSTITLSYHGGGGFSAEFRFIYDSDDDSAKMYGVHFYIGDSSDGTGSESATTFSVDEDSGQARALETLVAYAQENFDLSEYDLYVNKDTGKNYYSYAYNGQVTAFSTTFEASKSLNYSDFPMIVTVGGTEVTIGKDTPRDLMKKGWKEYTEFSELKNSKESQPFYMWGKDSVLYRLYLEPTVGINPEDAKITNVVIWTDNGRSFRYMDINQNTDIFTVISKLGEPNVYRMTCNVDSFIHIYYAISDTTEVSFDFIVKGDTPELYAFYLECKDDN